MAIKLTTTGQSASHVKALCYGDAGVGKTVLCATAPNPIIISAESGLLSLSHLDIPVIQVDTLDDVTEAYQFITESEDAKQFETVCLDSITEIAEVMLSQYKKDDKDPRKSYGALADHMSQLVRSFRDLEGRHVYFSAKMQRIEDEYTGISTFRPMMPGKNLVNGLPFFFDEVMALRIGEEEDGTKYRYLQTEPDAQFTAKDRSGNLDLIERPDLTHMFDKVLGRKSPRLSENVFVNKATGAATDKQEEETKEEETE
jgi:hypothetical protein